ncbi:MAG: FAD-dependent oxidoreductase [Coriobacteriales bacterium]|nr:FAD-dependent oxidoreductase [Coriobacteriales bacterium]
MELTRRNFVEGAAALTGAAAFASLAPAALAEEAEYDRPWEHAPEPITDAVDGGTYDILVIGAGIGGVAAAEAASTNGASVLVVEQAEGLTCHGVDLGHVGSKWQKENGFDIDPADAAMLVYRWSQ